MDYSEKIDLMDDDCDIEAKPIVSSTYLKNYPSILNTKQLMELENLMKEKISDNRVITEIMRFLAQSNINVIESTHIERGTIIVGIGEKNKFNIF